MINGALATSPKAGRARRRRRSRFSEDKLRRILLTIVVGGSVLAFGAQHAAVTCLLALPCAALAVISVGRLERLPAMLWLLLGLVVFTLLQVIPLPLAWLGVVAPHSADVWSGLSALDGSQRVRASISLDPGASALEALRWGMYAAVLAGALVARRERTTVWLAELLFLSALAVALITLLHGLVGAERIYGIYQPSFTVERFRRGPLLNSNNLSGYLNLGLGAAAGLWLSGRTKLPHWLLGVGTLLVLSLDLASGSRGGLLALVLAAVVLGIWYARTASVSQTWRTSALVAGSLGVLGSALALLLGGNRLIAELASGDVARKVAAWRWSLDLIRENTWLGVGRGAFESAFGAYRGRVSADWTAVFSHPENIALQWVTEWGVVVGGGALVVGAALLLRAFVRGSREALQVGLGLGLVALVAQNLVDLSSEVPGVAVAMVVAAAAILDRPQAPEAPPSLRPMLVAGAGATLLVLLAFALGRQPVHLERDQLSQRYRALNVKDAAARTAFRAELAGAMSRHPAEAYFPLLGGLVANRGRDQNALRWLNRALELGPSNGTTHLALADTFRLKHAVGQAFLHLKLAVEHDVTLQGSVTTRAVKWARNLDELELAFPDERRAELLAEACARYNSLQRAIPCWRRTSEQAPSEVTLRERLVESLARATEQQVAPCAGTEQAACVTEVRAQAGDLSARKPASWRGPAALARVTRDEPEQKALARQVLQACPGGVAGADCAREALVLADRFALLDLAAAAAEKVIATSCSTNAACAEAHDSAAGLFIRHDAWGLGLRHRVEAARLTGTATAWISVVQAAAHARSFPTGYVALQRAEALPNLLPEERARLELARAELRSAASTIVR
jgi:O-Antigen ligase